MLLKDLRKAIREGKLIDITGVKLRSWGEDNQLPAVLHISFDVPSVENKPVCDNLDIAEVSLSTKPEYDPCRRFKMGDIVEVRIRDGRIPWGTLTSGSRIHLNSGRRYVVLADENRNDVRIEPIADVTNIAHTNITVDACYLELVIPVEELEPFDIYKSDDNEYVILFEDTRVSTFPFKGDGYPYYYTQEQAKARAEQERDRLNDEWRKKQK